MGSIHTTENMEKLAFSKEAGTQKYAQCLDSEDPLRSFRDKFIIPSKANFKSKNLAKPGPSYHAVRWQTPDNSSG